MTSDEHSEPPSNLVHFVSGDRHLQAIVTDSAFVVREEGKPDWIGQALTVFPIGQAPFTTVATYDPDGAPGTWHWPESPPPSDRLSSYM